MEEYLEFAKTIAMKAGDIIKNNFDTDYSIKIKEGGELVTEIDEEVNQFVIDEIGRAYPKHSVLGEEKSVNKSSEYVWACDPIDGTIMFTKGVPISVFSLALVKDGEPIVGVVRDPYTNRLYYASKGGGAFLNGKPIRVSKLGLVYDSVIDIAWWPEADCDIHKVSHDLSMETKALFISLFSVTQASCLVANGQFEASIFAGTKGKAVDMAAVKVIVEEAGGKVTDLFGNEQRYDRDIKGAIASNGVCHEQLVKAYSKLGI
jgi:myo-inositol-1(or 4)-monophosphatase